jgi:hypothetical protein
VKNIREAIELVLNAMKPCIRMSHFPLVVCQSAIPRLDVEALEVY